MFAYANTDTGLAKTILRFFSSLNSRRMIQFFQPVLVQMILVYTVIYFLLPRVLNRKNWIITIALSLVLLAAVFAATYLFTYLTGLAVARSGRRPQMPNEAYLLTNSLRIFLFIYPSSVGFALAIKLTKRWWLKQRETEQLAKEKATAELELLKSRVHPHFLFNSLNNIYSFTLEASPKAPEMIQKLSGLLHYMLYDCKQSLVPLDKELKMISDYISLEKIRYGDRLKMNVNINNDHHSSNRSGADELQSYGGGANTNGDLIAPLLLIPFVENCFKHGTSKMLANPFVILDVKMHDGILFFDLKNSRPEYNDGVQLNGNRGIGLKNVKKRLELLYPRSHEMQVSEDPTCYSVFLKIDLNKSAFSNKKQGEQKVVRA